MPSNQYIGLGITLSINSVVMDQVTDIGFPEISIDTVETTNLASTWCTFLPTLPDGGEVTFEAIFDPADTAYTGLLTLAGTPAVVPVVIEFTAATKKMTFSAILTKLKPGEEAEVKTLLMVSGTLKVTGIVAIAAGP